MEYKRLNDYLNELKFNKRADLLSEVGEQRLVELEHALEQLKLSVVSQQRELLIAFTNYLILNNYKPKGQEVFKLVDYWIAINCG